MDNPQITDTDLAWLAGIIDGEGSMGVYGQRRKNGTLNYSPRLQIALTHAGGIERIVQILRGLGINAHLWEKPAKRPQWSDAWYTTVSRLADLKILLPKVMPYLTIRKAEARLLLEYVGNRPSHNKGGNGHINIFTEREKRLIDAVKKLNTLVTHLTDYALAPLEGEDIVVAGAKVPE